MSKQKSSKIETNQRQKKVAPKTRRMLKVYEDIINEVVSRLEEDGDSVNIGKATIYELRNDWREKLSEHTRSEWTGDGMVNRGMYSQGYPGYGGLRGRVYSFPVNERLERRPKPNSEEDKYGSEVTSSDDDLEMVEDNTGNYMICLYVKVNKSKNKWKCVFKQGFINIGNIDFAFNSAQGELEW